MSGVKMTESARELKTPPTAIIMPMKEGTQSLRLPMHILSGTMLRRWDFGETNEIVSYRAGTPGVGRSCAKMLARRAFIGLALVESSRAGSLLA